MVLSQPTPEWGTISCRHPASSRMRPRSCSPITSSPTARATRAGSRARTIPLGSRIIMVVAAFDAMTSDRPYRRGLSPGGGVRGAARATRARSSSPTSSRRWSTSTPTARCSPSLDEAHLERTAQGTATRAPSRTPGASGLARAREAPARSAGAEGRGRVLPVLELPDPRATRPRPYRPLRWREVRSQMSRQGKGMAAGRSPATPTSAAVAQNNEDSFGIYESADTARGCLLVLADGMGGAAAGEVASRWRWTRCGTLRARQARDAGEGRLKRGFEAANRRSVPRSIVRRQPPRRHGDDVHGGGDRRPRPALGARGRQPRLSGARGSIEQLTQDHTLAAEMARMGGPRGGAMPEATSHALTRCIGSRPRDHRSTCRPSRSRSTTGSSLVLCSDGLSNVVQPDEILDLLRPPKRPRRPARR